MPTLLAIMPATDSTEQIQATWASRLVEGTRAGDYPLIDSVRDYSEGNATRQNVDDSLPRNGLVVYCGHGSLEGAALGDPSLIDETNLGRAQGSIVIALACDSARTLGRIATRNLGIIAYFGYEEDLPVLDYPAITASVSSSLELLATGSTLEEVLDFLKSDLRPLIDAHRPGRGAAGHDDDLIWLTALVTGGNARILGDSSARLP
jgi:hypothetical protein